MLAAQPSLKRKRLSHACTNCRSRKVKCDELEPSCTRCLKAGVACITIDPHTGNVAQRREAQSQSRPAVPSPPPSANGVQFQSSPGTPALFDHHVGAVEEDSGEPARDHVVSPAASSKLLPMLPRFLNGDGLFVLTQWLDLTFSRLNLNERVHLAYTSIPRQNYRVRIHAGTISELLARTPDPRQIQKAFHADIGQVIPLVSILDEDHLQNPAASDEIAAVERILLHAITLGTSVDPSERRFARSCFDYSFSHLFEFLEGKRSLSSIRVLVLLVLYLRWHEDMDKAWQMLSLAVASVHNQGLHDEQSASSIVRSDVFWSVFILDKIMALELERTPLLPKRQCSRPLPTTDGNLKRESFVAMVRLALLQDEILNRLQDSRKSEEDAQDAAALRESVRLKIRLAGELDDKLVKLGDSFPQDLKPTEYSYADPASLPSVVFVGVQFYQTMFLLSRNALLLNMDAIRGEIDKALPSHPSTNRIKNGQNVCAMAARSILGMLDHANEMKVRSIMFTSRAPVLATYALAVFLMRRQSVTTARIDLEYQARAISLVKVYTALSSNEDHESTRSNLSTLLEKLHHLSESYVQQSSEDRTSAVVRQQPTASSDHVNYAYAIRSPLPQAPDTHSWRAPASSLHGLSEINTHSGSTMTGHAPFTVHESADEPTSGLDQALLGIDWDALSYAFSMPL